MLTEEMIEWAFLTRVNLNPMTHNEDEIASQIAASIAQAIIDKLRGSQEIKEAKSKAGKAGMDARWHNKPITEGDNKTPSL